MDCVSPLVRIPVSTVLLTKNVAHVLPKYFASMQNVDDIIVFDGDSTDGTRELIATQSNCRIFPQNPAFLDAQGYIINFSGMRNEGYTLARHPWILCVDADETASPELLENVSKIVKGGMPGVYYVRRLFTIHGEPIISFDASDHVRLFHRSCVRGCVKPVHERLDIIPGSFVGHLGEVVYVPIDNTKSVRPKYDRYLRVEAQALRECSWGRWLRWVFFRNLFSIVRRVGVIIILRILPKKGPRYPLSLEYEQIRYSWLLLWRTIPFHL